MTGRNQSAKAAGRRTDAYGWLRRVGMGRSSIHWYVAAAACLLAVAAALRFYELGQPLAHFDEVDAALNARGTFTEVIQHNRVVNFASLLYSLILYGVQQIDNSPFSIRFVPALSGVLSVAVILLLPRWGVQRSAALLGAILAALAPEAIYEARGAREYGVDALVATLLIAGLLWYRRDGGKALLCAALLVSPLLQYGLVLFGVAIIGVGLILPPLNWSYTNGQSRQDSIKDWLRRRTGLVWPTAFFLAGCGISYLTTLRYQLETTGLGFARDAYYNNIYYRDDYRIIPVLEFAMARIGDIISHHLPLWVIIAVAGAVAVCLISAGVGRYMGRGRGYSAAKARYGGGHWELVATLFALALMIAVIAALLGLYPARQTRHITYLGPAVFVFSGVALAAAIRWLTLLTAIARRERLSLALAIAAAAMITGASVGEIRHNSPY